MVSEFRWWARGRGCEDVNDADGADADHVGESGLSFRVLATTGFAPKLVGDLADLADAGWADGVAHGEKAPGGADCDAAANVELPGLEVRGGVAGRTDTDGFEVSNGVLDLGVTAVVGFEGDGLTGAVGDQGVIGVHGEQSQLRSRGGFGAPHDEPASFSFVPEWLIGDLGDIGASEVRDWLPLVLGIGATRAAKPLYSLAVIENATSAWAQASTT